jgi:two-component system, chemotaxis family, CheB/CheR fusion protein
VIQEAIKNASVHGKAKNIEISIMESKGEIILKITDDGVGLADAPKEMKGKGLRIMKHRMELLGGTFNISDRSDSDNKGTVVTCTIPLEDLYNRDE